MAMDALIRFLFSDEGASAGVGKLNAKLNELKRSGPDARRGLAALETGMRGLAFQAINVGGPVGKLAESLLRFGGGSALILGAAAGIGGLVLAYRSLTAITRESTAAQEELIKKLQAMGPAARATAAAIEQAAAAGGQENQSFGARWLRGVKTLFGPSLTEQTERVARGEAALRMQQAGRGQWILERIEALSQKAEADRAKASADRERAREDQLGRINLNMFGGPAESHRQYLKAVSQMFGGPNQRAIDALAPRGFGAAAISATGAEARQHGQRVAEGIFDEERLARVRSFTLQITRDMLTPQQQFADQMARVAEALAMGEISASGAANAERHLAAERDKTIKQQASGLQMELKQQQGERLSRLAAGLSLGTAAISAASGRGGFGSVLGAGGAFAATFPGGQIPGLAISALGGIVSLFEGQHREREAAENRRHAELIGVLHEGPMRVTNTFQQGYGQGSSESMYAYDRAKRLGREARLP